MKDPFLPCFDEINQFTGQPLKKFAILNGTLSPRLPRPPVNKQQLDIGCVSHLTSAELAQAGEGSLAPSMSEEEHLKRELTDSRFDDFTNLPGN